MTFPSGYKRLDYIESHGDGAYINTLVPQTSNISISFDLQFTSYSSVYNPVCESYNGSVNPSYLSFNNGSHGAYAYNGGFITYEYPISFARHTYSYTKGVGWMLDSTLVSSAQMSYNTNLNLYIFTISRNDGGNMTFAKAKLYGSTFYNDGILVRNFIPSLRESDNAIGLLDLVNNVFYENQGTGAFTYGHILDENITIEDNPLEFELQDNVSLQANFELAGYQITTQVNPLGSGTTSGDGVYSEGASVTLSATTNQGNQFVNWTLNGVEVSTNPSYTFTMGSQAQTYVANFVAREFIECIYDRNQDDIINKTSKAYMNIVDWNRIENNLDYLSVRYQISNTFNNWVYTDIPTIEKVNTLLTKLNVLKAKVSESPSLPTTILNYTHVNDIEYFLYFMYEFYIHRIEIISQPVSGFYNANEPNVLMAQR